MMLDPGFPVPKFLKSQAEQLIVRSALEGLRARAEGGVILRATRLPAWPGEGRHREVSCPTAFIHEHPAIF